MNATVLACSPIASFIQKAKTYRFGPISPL